MTLYKIDAGASIWEYSSEGWGGKSTIQWLQISDPGTRTISLAGGLGYITLVRLDADRSIWGYVYNQPVEGNPKPIFVWNRLDNNPNTRAIAGSNAGFYQLHGDGSIWAYTDSWQELDNNPATRTIVAGPIPTPGFEATIGPLYKLHGDGSLWQFTTSLSPPPPPPITSRVIESYESYRWQQLDDTGDTIAVAQDYSTLYQLRGDGSIWSYTGTPLSWLQLYPPSKVRSIVAGCDSRGPSLYFLDGDGLVAQYTGTPGAPSCRQLGTNPATIAIAYDFVTSPYAGTSQLYRLDGDGSIWVYVEGILPPPPKVAADNPTHPPSSLPPTPGWQKIDSNPGTVSIWTVPLGAPIP